MYRGRQQDLFYRGSSHHFVGAEHGDVSVSAFTALKKQGVPVEYIRYPRSSHELSRSGEPWLLVDRLGRLRDWFSHWLMKETPSSTGRKNDTPPAGRTFEPNVLTRFQ
jgi:hypothetical protein